MYNLCDYTNNLRCMVKNAIQYSVFLFALILFFVTLYLAYGAIKHFIYGNYTEFFERLTSFLISYIATAITAYIGNQIIKV